jgi:hypothetical protein
MKIIKLIPLILALLFFASCEGSYIDPGFLEIAQQQGGVGYGGGEYGGGDYGGKGGGGGSGKKSGSFTMNGYEIYSGYYYYMFYNSSNYDIDITITGDKEGSISFTVYSDDSETKAINISSAKISYSASGNVRYQVNSSTVTFY